jgi:hypothetical protein
MMVVILAHGIYHTDPLSPLHPAIPISLTAVRDVIIIKRWNNTLISANCYQFTDQIPMKDQFFCQQKKWYQFLSIKLLKHTSTHVQWAQLYSTTFSFVYSCYMFQL